VATDIDRRRAVGLATQFAYELLQHLDVTDVRKRTDSTPTPGISPVVSRAPGLGDVDQFMG
jgi:hypothetical protein